MLKPLQTRSASGKISSASLEPSRGTKTRVYMPVLPYQISNTGCLGYAQHCPACPVASPESIPMRTRTRLGCNVRVQTTSYLPRKRSKTQQDNIYVQLPIRVAYQYRLPLSWHAILTYHLFDGNIPRVAVVEVNDRSAKEVRPNHQVNTSSTTLSSWMKAPRGPAQAEFRRVSSHSLCPATRPRARPLPQARGPGGL